LFTIFFIIYDLKDNTVILIKSGDEQILLNKIEKLERKPTNTGVESEFL